MYHCILFIWIAIVLMFLFSFSSECNMDSNILSPHRLVDLDLSDCDEPQVWKSTFYLILVGIFFH